MSRQTLAHSVFFTLHDASEAAQEALVAACQKYLAGDPSMVYFAVGTLVQELQRPVNDRDFHVALHVVFRSKADHDAYQQTPQHLQFIAENKANWKQVRVFDAFVQ